MISLMEKTLSYESPTAEILEILPEQCLAFSIGAEDPVEDEMQGW